MQILKKILLCSFVFCALAANASAQNNGEKPTNTLNTNEKIEANKFSEAFGVLVGGDLANAGITADYVVMADFTAAVQAAWDKNPIVDIQQAVQTMQDIMAPIRAAKQAGTPLPELNVENKVAFSKAIGTLLGDNMGQMGVKDFNSAEFSAGFFAALSGKPSMTQAEAEAEYKTAMAAIRNEKDAAINAQKGELEKDGKAFLAKNKDKKGVKTTASGLQYEVLKAGKGAKPTLESKVKVHYHGTLIDGTVFDSSVDRGEPLEFPLGSVIEGWQEGVQLMPLGSKYRFYIPHEIAYGAQAIGKIPAFSTLIFEVELLGIE
jgi:FKBP-type peptidyl-prolyl cis-trans isomerase